jgi:CO/xanthine dehydrogenase Mo-binding subunit
MPGAGCYGHNGADDVAFDAALISQYVKLPVRVQWMREDEMTHSPFGSASAVRIAAAMDEAARICAWDLEIWSHTHCARPGHGEGINLLGAWQMDPPAPKPNPTDIPLPAGGGHRNAISYYALPHQRVTYHFLEQSPCRTSSLRSLGAYANTFAIESFMDELAETAGIDPLEFRLRHLDDPRARAVLECAAQMAAWEGRGESGRGTGLGIGFGRYKNRSAYFAAVAQVRVEEQIHVERIWAAVDAGAVVNPDGLLNQIEGGVLQSLSWALKEEVRWDASGIVSNTWESYPILTFGEIPTVNVKMIGSQREPPLGIGEVAAGPTAGAIGNAVAHALGVRARHLPITTERLEQLVHEAG